LNGSEESILRTISAVRIIAALHVVKDILKKSDIIVELRFRPCLKIDGSKLLDFHYREKAYHHSEERSGQRSQVF
jgi:hypothetical protein